MHYISVAGCTATPTASERYFRSQFAVQAPANAASLGVRRFDRQSAAAVHRRDHRPAHYFHGVAQNAAAIGEQ
jgi:hypothetical protein